MEMKAKAASRMRGAVGAPHARLLLAVGTVLALGCLLAPGASAAHLEAEPSFPVKPMLRGNAAFLETARGRVITCSDSEGGMEMSNFTELKSVGIRYKGCFAERVALLTCQSGSTLGEIVTNALRARPVDLNAGKTEAGLLLEPESGELFAEFKCEFGPVKETLKVKGSIIGKVPNAELNEFRETLHLEFNETNGVPEPNQVEGKGEKDVLSITGEGTEPFEGEEAGIQEAVPGTTVLTVAEGKKIKLVP
jgi:hypothetical protein